MSLPAAQAEHGTLAAPPTWRSVDFISDLHLQASEPETFAAFAHYLANSSADALVILGDLFEVWVGDDILKDDHPAWSGFEQQCQRQLAQAAGRMPIFFMHGNRDFLFGTHAAQACQVHVLQDPNCLIFDGQRWLLSHGDALCTDDEPYQRFRQLVRSPAWQQEFLAKPLAERIEIAKSLRAQSEALKAQSTQLVDVNADLARRWLDSARASTLIHGHTHRPAEHALRTNPSAHRWVLSDWDARASPARLEVLRLQSGQGLRRLRLDAAIMA